MRTLILTQAPFSSLHQRNDNPSSLLPSHQDTKTPAAGATAASPTIGETRRRQRQPPPEASSAGSQLPESSPSHFFSPTREAPSLHLRSQPRLAATVPATTIGTREHHGSPTPGLCDPDRHHCAPSLSFFFLRETDAQSLLSLFSSVARTASASFS
ncbi:hypothetical protein DEO72_LG9g544 [Vigna unguiculata]|uniref:Uncharacterized protein n=1 Tax=Vigna unguiculata TaxID=3917 RepID=A0A4D6MY04_VIGUN|nr:hypothetical protein DEO72_LG9g544 [Vigna unguiculata]